MSYCGSSPGLCGHRTDCADKHCPGRFEAIGYEAMLGLHTHNGGEHIDFPPTAEEAASWVAPAIVYALIVAVAILGAVLHTYFR